jgi:hypothetical protein
VSHSRSDSDGGIAGAEITRPLSDAIGPLTVRAAHTSSAAAWISTSSLSTYRGGRSPGVRSRAAFSPTRKW